MTTTEQPTALRMADWLDDHYVPTHSRTDAAAELRRQHDRLTQAEDALAAARASLGRQARQAYAEGLAVDNGGLPVVDAAAPSSDQSTVGVESASVSAPEPLCVKKRRSIVSPSDTYMGLPRSGE